MPAAAPSLVTPHSDHLAVFVHGFGSSPKCWNRLQRALEATPDVRAQMDLQTYAYRTGWFNANLLGRLPDVEDVSSGLGRWLDSPPAADYRQLTLVGHSQGGLVILFWLAQMVEARRAEELSRLRQVILIASPLGGSMLVHWVRRVLFALLPNPQEEKLRVFNAAVHQRVMKVHDAVACARQRGRDSWPVPVVCFWGDADRIVPPVSARGPFEESGALAGTHFSVIKPKGANHPVARAIAAALLAPPGHRGFFEIEEYRTEIAVEPRPADFTEEVVWGPQPHQRRTVNTDHVATVSRTVAFSPRNRCTDLFELRYRTRSGHAIRPTCTPDRNEAPAKDRSRYEDTGKEFSFQFTPEAGKRFRLHVDVWGGFGEGNRDLHFHLGQRSCYRLYTLRLDLSRYLAAGFRLDPPPALYFHPQDPGSCDLCSQRQLAAAVAPARDGAATGVWEWELREVLEGVVDLRWALGAPAGESARSRTGAGGTV